MEDVHLVLEKEGLEDLSLGLLYAKSIEAARHRVEGLVFKPTMGNMANMDNKPTMVNIANMVVNMVYRLISVIILTTPVD